MNELKVLHRDAMERVDLALSAKSQGEVERALAFFLEAYDLESKAALSLSKNLDAEPTRSVLLRSAATIALDCNLIADAERLICVALAGNPPLQIAEELRDLWEQVNFQRHLDLRGISLHEDEIQMSIAGKADAISAWNYNHPDQLIAQLTEALEALRKRQLTDGVPCYCETYYPGRTHSSSCEQARSALAAARKR